MRDTDLEAKIKGLIDDLKAVCNTYGLSGDGNEYKIISQSFLYKFLNDKFIHDVREKEKSLKNVENLQNALLAKTEDEYAILMARLGGGTAKLKPTHLISYLYAQQNVDEFYKVFNETLNDIAVQNSAAFSVHTAGGKNILLFDSALFNAITDEDKRDDAARAVINRLSNDRFDFVEAFGHGFDFFSTIFEYLIKDYNSNAGNTYAEYYTPHSVAGIIAKVLIGEKNKANLTSQKVLDPAAGSGTLLMNIAHEIGTDKCSVYSQDISQKSSNLLRLNLILNNLPHSISNVVEGNTLTDPAHMQYKGKFDFIVSNPPFNADFSEYRDDIADESIFLGRFFAGIPNIPNKKKEAMPIYLLFIQHILWMLSEKGNAAIVCPTGFLTAQKGIGYEIHKKIIDGNWLEGVISMPANIFANTGTSVSVLFINKHKETDKVMLVDASNLGEKRKEGKNQRTILRSSEINKIIDAYLSKEYIDKFAVLTDVKKIKDMDYMLSAGPYFEVKINFKQLDKEEFSTMLKAQSETIEKLFAENQKTETDLINLMKDF